MTAKLKEEQVQIVKPTGKVAKKSAKEKVKEGKYLFTGPDWTFDLIQKAFVEIEKIALEELKVSVFSSQIEIISAEQMLDNYTNVGLPINYSHWSMGKHFIRDESMYRRGQMNLAYEIVINSDPTIAYCMEENTAMMQLLVVSHAIFGHGHFFKNNYLFKAWTSPDTILDYMIFAKDYIKRCEERYGEMAVEQLLDSLHALQDYGVDRFHKPEKLSLAKEIEKQKDRIEYEEKTYNELWRTVDFAVKNKKDKAPTPLNPDIISIGGGDLLNQQFAKDELNANAKKQFNLPEENILYFIEKYSPILKPWQREVVRIVRKISQYFYPQKQTKVMNEGCATFVHYYIMNRLYDKGLINEGSMLEFLASHTGVIRQPDFDERGFSGFNPYALGFAMMQDIVRICEDPTDEDREWFPDLAGSGDGLAALRYAWENYRDESFILQYLSPKVMRDFHMFALSDGSEDFIEVSKIHNERGYDKVRKTLAGMYNLSNIEPDIQIADVNMTGDRTLTLRHTMLRDIPLSKTNTEEVLKHLSRLWGYPIVLKSVSYDGSQVKSEFRIK